MTAAGGPGPRTRDDGGMRPERDDQDDKPLLPAQSTDETSVGWGEVPEPDDEERLRQERPPHWDE